MKIWKIALLGGGAYLGYRAYKRGQIQKVIASLPRQLAVGQRSPAQIAVAPATPAGTQTAGIAPVTVQVAAGSLSGTSLSQPTLRSKRGLGILR